jgi:ubiquinone/menaquinone biosynthesis C-methylase UbiE
MEGRRLFPRLHFDIGDIYHLAQASRSWDVVIVSEVLEHLDRPGEALDEVIRVAQRYVLLSVPHEPWFRIGNLARGRHVRRFGNHPEHVNLWSRKSFVQFVGKHATVQTVTGAFPWTIVLAKA